MNHTGFISIANEYCKTAEVKCSQSEFLEASDYFFYAAELYEKTNNDSLAIDCYKLSFLCNLKSMSIMKNYPDEGYLGSYENLIVKRKDFDIACNDYSKIEFQLRENGYNDLSKKYYLKKMYYMKLYLYQNKNVLKGLFFYLWQMTSNFGVSISRWVLSIFIFSLVYMIILLPAHYDFMQSLEISVHFRVETLFDYWFLGFISIAPWDWLSVIPVNIIGKLIIVSKLIVGFVFFGILMDMIERKLYWR